MSAGPSSDGSSRIVADRSTGLHLLLFDHNLHCPPSLETALSELATRGVSVEQVLTLGSAVDRVANSTPAIDLIIFNLHDGGDASVSIGLAMLAEMPDVPMVVLAGAQQERAAVRLAEHGALDILMPDDLQVDYLQWRLVRAIEQHRMNYWLDGHIRELEVTNGRFLSLVSDNADAIIVVDHIGVVRFVNPSAERLLRRKAREILGQMFGVPLEGVEVTEIELSHGSRGPQTAELRVTNTLWDGELAYIVTMRDVTDRKRAETALTLAKQTAEQASAMKSQFLANMSHELRTPLNAIVGYSEMMMLDIGGHLHSKRFRQYAADIHNGGTHLLSLINDLLDLAKAESGKLDLYESNFDLKHVVEAVHELIVGQAIAKDLDFTLDMPAEAIWIRADERVLKQIALNLLSNAVKFTPRGGRVSLRLLRGAGGETRIRVTDTGVGMAREDIPRAFAAFVQIEGVYTKERNQGTGLGLALAKRFVEMHSGRISIDSKLGAGTTVTVTLPADRSISTRGTDTETVTHFQRPDARNTMRS